MPSMKALKDELDRKVYGITSSEATKQGICVCCRKEVASMKLTKLAQAEYNISGLCNVCFFTVVPQDGDEV